MIDWKKLENQTGMYLKIDAAVDIEKGHKANSPSQKIKVSRYTTSISILLMTWEHKNPGHQEI